MNLLLLGSSFHSTPIAVRERLAFDGPKLTDALTEINSRYGFEVVIVSTCNRVEVYAAQADGNKPPDAGVLAEFVAEFHNVPLGSLQPHFYHEVGRRRGAASFSGRGKPQQFDRR